MTTTAIAIRDDQTTFDDLQRQALTHLGVHDARPADLAVFFHTCKRTGLDPFAKQIYMIQRDGKQTMQTGIDGLRLVAHRVAERTRESFGYENTEWCGTDGQWRDVWLSQEPPAAARIVVLRNGERFPGLAVFREFAQRKRDGSLTKNWSEKPALMLAKCAEAAALRKAFPLDLAGVYTPDEMPAEQPASAPRQTGLNAIRAALGVEQPERSEPVDVTDAEVLPDLITDAQLKAIMAGFGEVGLRDRALRLAYCRKVVGREIGSSKDLTKDEASRVLDALNQDMADAAATDGEVE